MGTMHNIYVRISNRDDELKNVRKLIRFNRRATLKEREAENDFVEIEWNRFERPQPLLQQLSSELVTDVIWLGFQSVVDAFEYEHWHAGVCLRSLTFGCNHEERTWERVEGAPERWEPPEIARGKVGTSDSLDGRETARLVAGHYRLPGWFLE